MTPCAPSAVEIYGLQMFEEILEKAEEIADLHLVSHVVINNADTRSTKRIGDMQAYIHGKPNHFLNCVRRLLAAGLHLRQRMNKADR